MADYDLQYQDTHIDALLATANELKTAGFIYKGVATPSTNPGTPTERVAYLASEPGTYTNFNSLAVTGLSILTYNGSTWSASPLNLNIDNTPLDLSSFTRSAGCPQDFVYWIVQGNRTHIDIPVQPGQMYKICANANLEAIFVLLKQQQTPSNHLPYDFATGEVSIRFVPASSCATITIPADCTCMAVAIDGSGTVTRDYTPSSIELLSTPNKLQEEIDKTNELIESYHPAPVRGNVTRCGALNSVVLKWYNSEGAFILPINPNQKFKIVGNASFVQLKSNTVTIGEVCDFSDYWSGWNTINYNITTTNENILYAAPDVHYIWFSAFVEVYLYDEYNIYQRNQFQYTDMLKYMMNKSCQYVIHQYLRTTHPGIETFNVTGDEQSFRGCSAVAEALAGIYSLGIMDLSVIGTTTSNLIWQCKRMILSAVNSYNNWKQRWQSSLAAAKYGNAAYMIKDFLSTSEYNSVLACVESEANTLVTKQVGTRWNDNFVFGLYWKNSDGTTNFNGDSKSEEVGWYASCLATAIFLMPENANAANWKRKLVEWSVISYASPSSKTSGQTFNGYALSNLTGYNITDDGLVYNHNIIHPDYMASRSLCLYDGFLLWIKEGKMIPKAAQYNMNLIYYGYTKREFTQEEPNVQPPYGTIYKVGANDLYFPQGNDWGSVRFYSLAEYAGLMYNLCLHSSDDTSRISTILWAHVKQLQDRFKTGAVHKEDGSENSYAGREPSMACEIFEQLIVNLHPIFWTDDDWYT